MKYVNLIVAVVMLAVMFVAWDDMTPFETMALALAVSLLAQLSGVLRRLEDR